MRPKTELASASASLSLRPRSCHRHPEAARLAVQVDHQHVNREKRLGFFWLEKAKGNLFVSTGFDKPFFLQAGVMANQTPLFNYTFKATFDKHSLDLRINSALNQTSKHLSLSCKWVPFITISLISLITTTTTIIIIIISLLLTIIISLLLLLIIINSDSQYSPTVNPQL